MGLTGVAAAEPMMHRFAYVGSDLQDMYGIDPRAIGRATKMSDAFFGNGNSALALAALASTHDGVLVSEETVSDFQLQPDDTLNLRLQNASDHKYHVAPFRFVGVAREFPTAPRDSFLVANADYVAKMTGDSAAEVVLMSVPADPETVAVAARKVFADARNEIAAFLWSEAVVVVGAGFAIGGAIGLAVAYVLVRELGGVFDPPPEGLSIPWPYLATVAVSALASAAAVVLIAARALDERRVEALREL